MCIHLASVYINSFISKHSMYPTVRQSARWTLNGWSPHEIAGFALCVALLSPLVVWGSPERKVAGKSSNEVVALFKSS